MLTDVLCSSCTHAIFNEQWGEWKCKKSETRIYDISKASFCVAELVSRGIIPPNEARRRVGLGEI